MPIRMPGWPTLFQRLRSEPLAECPDRELLERFAERRDERAFDALLGRHGPMVLGVCRRSAGEAHLADDVFQATFLVLARDATKVRWRESVAGYLFSIARRLARKAKRGEAARQRREAVAAGQRAEPGDPAWQELLLRLDAELERLPDRYRAPLLLCYHEGRTQDEAAAQLGWSRSTLRRRLECGRAQLRERLTGLGAMPPLAAPLREAALNTVFAEAKGAVVSQSVLALADAGALGSVGKVASVFALVAFLGLAAGAFHHPAQKPPPVAAGLADPEPPVAEPPLPPGAVARLGTLAFRHGYGCGMHRDSLTFTPDGKHLVSAGGGWVRRWNAVNGEALVTIGDGRLHTTRLPSTLTTADGRSGWINTHVNLEVSGSIWECKRYDTRTGKVVQSYRLPFPSKTGAAHALPAILSPDGRFFAELQGAWGDGGLVLYDATSGTYLRFHEKPASGPYTAMAFHPDGKGVLAGGDGHRFTLFDLKTGLPQRTFGGDGKDRVGRMAVSPDGKWLVTAGGQQNLNPPISPHDRFLRVWDLMKGTVARKIDFPEDHGVTALLFTPDSRAVIASVTGGRGNTVRTWDVGTGKAGQAWTREPTIGLTLAVRPDGKALATMNEAGVIRLWDLLSGKELSRATNNPTGLAAASFAPDGKAIWTAGTDLSLREWDAATGRTLSEARPATGGNHPEFSPGGKYLCATVFPEQGFLRGHRLHLWEAKGGKLVLDRAGCCPVFTPDESRLAYLDGDKRVQVIDLGTMKVTHTLKPPPGGVATGWDAAGPLAFTDGGRKLVLQGDDVSVWDLRTGKQVSSWSLTEKKVLLKKEPSGRHSWDRIEAVAASADGTKIAFSLLKDKEAKPGHRDWFGRVMIFETGGKLLHQIDGGVDSPRSLAFSPDGRRLAGGCQWVALVWDIDTGKETHRFEGHRGSVKGVAFRPDGRRLATASEDSTVLIWDVSK